MLVSHAGDVTFLGTECLIVTYVSLSITFTIRHVLLSSRPLRLLPRQVPLLLKLINPTIRPEQLGFLPIESSPHIKLLCYPAILNVRRDRDPVILSDTLSG